MEKQGLGIRGFMAGLIVIPSSRLHGNDGEKPEHVTTNEKISLLALSVTPYKSNLETGKRRYF